MFPSPLESRVTFVTSSPIECSRSDNVCLWRLGHKPVPGYILWHTPWEAWDDNARILAALKPLCWGDPWEIERATAIWASSDWSLPSPAGRHVSEWASMWFPPQAFQPPQFIPSGTEKVVLAKPCPECRLVSKINVIVLSLWVLR